MKINDLFILFIATGCFSGKIPFIPGTFGTVVGLPLAFLVSRIYPSYGAIFLVLFIFFSVFIARQAQIVLNQHDPGCIVIDEIAGIMITLYGLPFNGFNVLLGFILFRVLDIFKPFPIGIIDQKITGGTGVVLDDVAAGLMANIILRGIIKFLN